MLLQVPTLAQVWCRECMMLVVDADVAWLGQDVWEYDFCHRRMRVPWMTNDNFVVDGSTD